MKLHLAALNLTAALTLLRVTSAQAQKIDTRAEEAAIRALVNSSEHPPFTEDAVFWSGAYSRPIVGRDTANVKPHPDAHIGQRRNIKSTNEIVRLEVAAAGDMAYEFSNFTLSYDVADTQQHVSFPGSILRVWKKVNGQWRVVAAFARPHDTT
jgi:ketosteroid isomerase-like protein